MENKENKKSADWGMGCLVSVLAVLLIMLVVCAGGMVWKIKDLNDQKAVNVEQQFEEKKEKQNTADDGYEAEDVQAEDTQREDTQAVSSYVLNTNTKKVHFPDCRDVDRIALKNRVDSNEPLEEILRQGYEPCGHCMD